MKVDVCSRILYGVKAISMYSSSEGEEVVGLYPSGEFFLGDNRKIVHSSIKPILFPISCLIEQIQFRGEKIIPLVEMGKAAGFRGQPTVYLAYGSVYTALYEDGIEFCYHAEECSLSADRNKIPRRESFPCNEVEIVDWLNSHMIDYRGLIEKGLAKSVFDLKKNPYE